MHCACLTSAAAGLSPSSLVMGAGISAMHYTGMAAIDMTPPIRLQLAFGRSLVRGGHYCITGCAIDDVPGERISMPEIPRFTAA